MGQESLCSGQYRTRAPQKYKSEASLSRTACVGCFLANPCVFEEWAFHDDVYEDHCRPEGGALYFGRLLCTKLS